MIALEYLKNPVERREQLVLLPGYFLSTVGQLSYHSACVNLLVLYADLRNHPCRANPIFITIFIIIFILLFIFFFFYFFFIFIIKQVYY